MLHRYLGMLVSRAASNSVLLSDRVTVLVVPFTTVGLWIAGVKMTDTVQGALALSVAATVLAITFVRLFAASFGVWKDDQAEKKRLQHLLDAPQRAEVAEMKNFRAELRKELSERLGKLVSLAMQSENAALFNATYGDSSLFAKEYARAHEIIAQLSYDVALRVSAINLARYCAVVMLAQDGKQFVPEMGERLWAQRKLTFRIIHRDHQIAEMVTLIELESLVESHGDEGFGLGGKEGGPSSDLKRWIKSLGDKFHDPDLQAEIRAKIGS